MRLAPRGSVAVARARRPARPAAFTLAELMVVLCAIALLAAMLLPSLRQAIELGYATTCRRNLRCLAQTMHAGGTDAPLTLPAGFAWTGHAVRFGSRELLFCKKDQEDHDATAASLADFYILQNNGVGSSDWRVSNVQAVLEGNRALIGDSQIRHEGIPDRPTSHSTSNRPCWCWIPPRAANQELISVVDEACIRITFGGAAITIESFIGCNCSICNSDHWLMRGPARSPRTALRDDDVIMMLGGRNCRVPAPPFTLYTETASYGMNGRIRPRSFGPQQWMLMDANQIVIPVGEGDWMDRIQPRHLGKVNVVTVGGSVQTATKAEMFDEFLLLDEQGPGSTSLWDPHATPRAAR